MNSSGRPNLFVVTGVRYSRVSLYLYNPIQVFDIFRPFSCFPNASKFLTFLWSEVSCQSSQRRRRRLQISVSQPFLIRGTLPCLQNNLVALMATIYQQTLSLEIGGTPRTFQSTPALDSGMLQFKLKNLHTLTPHSSASKQ